MKPPKSTTVNVSVHAISVLHNDHLPQLAAILIIWSLIIIVYHWSKSPIYMSLTYGTAQLKLDIRIAKLSMSLGETRTHLVSLLCVHVM